MNLEEKNEALQRTHDEVLNLKESSLYQYRVENKYFPVFGEGNHEASIVFVGEAPGKNEAQTGKPFCGASGKLLDELLNSISLKREDVYVTNIVKDRPPENRDPTPEEIALYGPFLERQLSILKPKVVATLGRFSMSYVLNMFNIQNTDNISANHGKIFMAPDGTVILPLYHPAAAIYNRKLRDILFKDFSVIQQYI